MSKAINLICIRKCYFNDRVWDVGDTVKVKDAETRDKHPALKKHFKDRRSTPIQPNPPPSPEEVEEVVIGEEKVEEDTGIVAGDGEEEDFSAEVDEDI